MTVACYPTEEIVADYSSKPTQVSLLIRQRDTIQGIETKDFGVYKSWYERVLRKYDLWEKEEADLLNV